MKGNSSPRLSLIHEVFRPCENLAIAEMELLSLDSFISIVSGALRFGCSTVSIQSLDPVGHPGVIPSAHLHQIVGGSACKAKMTGDIGEQSSCTTCTFTEDFPNHWTAVMFFKHTNGSSKGVPIMQNIALPNGINGGTTIYYTARVLFELKSKDYLFQARKYNVFRQLQIMLTSLPQGFRMTVGSPTTSTLADAKVMLVFALYASQIKRHDSLTFLTFPTGRAKAGSRPSATFPRQCTQLFSQLPPCSQFTGCWGGQSLDSPDHHSHIFNTAVEVFSPAKPCPASHPVQMPQLAWDTKQFDFMWPAD